MPVQVTAFHDDWLPPPDSRKSVVTTGDAFEAMVRRLSASPALIFDTETSGTRWFAHARACGIALGCWDEHGQIVSHYVPFRHVTAERQLDLAVISPAIKALLENRATTKIGHNLIFDDHMCRREGWYVAGPRYDTMVAAHMFNENDFLALKYRARVDLGHADAEEWEKKLHTYVANLARANGMGIKAYMDAYGYSQVPASMCGHYACYDLQYTGELCQLYEYQGLQAKHPRIWPTEMALTECLCDVEENGLPIDVEYLELLRDSLGGVMASLEEQIFARIGRPLALSKDDELREFLYRDLKLAPFKYTRGKKESVDAEVLKTYKDAHPVVPLILQWRDAHKLESTYTTSILEKLDANHVLHGQLKQVGTGTGRLSSEHPNLQNFPSDDDERAQQYSGKKLEAGGRDPWSIRRAFVNRGPGWVRIYYDYSQIELRVLAFYSRDPIMVEAYLSGQDIHERTSLEVFGTKEKAARRKAKVINFGLSYCMTEIGFARQTGTPIDEARAYLERFFQRYAGIATFREAFWRDVMLRGGTFQNLFGRYRRLPDILAYGQAADRAKRQAIGSLIQGTAAELTKESLVRVWRWLKAEKIPAKIVTTIHDEIQIDTPVEYLAKVSRGTKQLMEDYREFLPIPIVAEGDYSITNWAEKQKLPH